MYEMAEAERFRNLYAYIEQISEEDKAEEGIYGARLAFCKDCEYLWEGMCRLCGCYVELRAAMKKNRCPGSPALW